MNTKEIKTLSILSIFFWCFMFFLIAPSSSFSRTTQLPLPKLEPTQKISLHRLKKSYDKTTIIWDKATKIPRFIAGKFSLKKWADIQSAAYGFFDEYKDLFKIKNCKDEFELKSVTKDDLDVTHLKFRQKYKGLNVYGAEMAVHINNFREITSINGRYIPDIKVDTNPEVSSDEGLRVALTDILHSVGNIPIHSIHPELIIYNDGTFLNEISHNRLLWKIELKSKKNLSQWVYLIDANKADIIYKYDDSKSLKNRHIYSSEETGEIPGKLWITEEGPIPGELADVSGWLTYLNLGIVYDYFYKNFNYSDWGKKQIASVHYNVNYEGAKWYDFMDNPQLVCGDGDKKNKIWGPACNSLDIVAHEMTHALFQYKKISLNCCGQPGAVEESYADIFGVFIDNKNWTIGESFYFPNNENKFYRSLSDPPSGALIQCNINDLYSQPDHMDNFVNTTCDKYGVHINSGILNKAAYNIASSIGREKTSRLYYNSILYLTEDTDFTQMSYILLAVCYDVFGFDSNECKQVNKGFTEVGL